MRSGFFVITAALMLWTSAAQASPAARVALVIGVSRYEKAPTLDNPDQDAKLIQATLSKLGFQVDVVTDPTRSVLVEALGKFEEDAKGADAAVIYFAGHGALIDGVNFLLPRDATTTSRSVLTGSSIESSRLSQALLGAKSVRLVILDACRDNPTSTRGVGGRGGLAREASRSSTQVVTLMAASPGEVALDGDGKNSPFATALAQGLSRPGMTVGALPGYVQTEVERLTESRQVPDLQGIWVDVNWIFQPALAPKPANAVQGPSWERDRVFWESIKDSDDAADFQAYIEAQDRGELTGAFRRLALNRLRSLERARAPAAVREAPRQDLVTNARAAFSRGDYAAAVKDWTVAAKASNSAAMFNLGVMAFTGRPPPQNREAAAKWFKAAAEAGHTGGMVNYGLSLLNGFGVEQNEPEGVRWLRLAAEKGSPTALGMVGEAYILGRGTVANPTEGAAWLKRAVAAGDGPAIAQLADLYETGTGVQRDPKQAFDFFRKAASSGDAQAMVRLGYLYEDGTVVPQDIVQAATWYQRAAEAGDGEGMSSLAVLFEGGSLGSDKQRAAQYYRAAADRGDARGYLGLGNMTARGEFVPQNFAEALRLFELAAQKGSVLGMRNAAIMYESGSVGPPDRGRAVAYYKQAAAAGDDVSRSKLQDLGVH